MIEKPSIVEVYDYYGLRILAPDRGSWRKAECPLHEDQNPSASINEDGEKFWCHACNQGGDSLDIIMEREGIVGLAGALAFAKEHFGTGDSQVRAGGGRSGLLPARQGSRPGRGNWQAPWRRI